MQITKFKIAGEKICVDYEENNDKYKLTSCDLPRNELRNCYTGISRDVCREIGVDSAGFSEIAFSWHDDDSIKAAKIKLAIETPFGMADLVLPEILLEGGWLKELVEALALEVQAYCSNKRAQLTFDDMGA